MGLNPATAALRALGGGDRGAALGAAGGAAAPPLVVGDAVGAEWAREPARDVRSASCDAVGLANLGCTCYMASLLQQLFRVPALRRGLLALDLGGSPHAARAGAAPEPAAAAAPAAGGGGGGGGGGGAAAPAPRAPPPPGAMLAELQALFGALALSERRAHAPRAR